MAFSHANCDHPSTPAARKKCRDNQKKLAEGKIKDTKSVRELQNALTEAFREQILGVGGITVAEIKDMLYDMPTDAVDEWFSGKLPAMMKVVEAQHKEAMLLTTKYLKEHAALLGYSAGKLDKIGMVWDQVTTSLEVTGPVAFKTHIAAGGTAEAAKKVMETTLSGSAERLALQGSHDTLTAAVANPDSNVLGYTRNTSSTACDYCAGLSTAAVYDSNTFHAHDHCTCTGEPLYLDPRFLPNAAEVDFDAKWDGAVDTDQRALELDRKNHDFDFELGGQLNQDMLDQFGPVLVWRELVDGRTRPYTPGLNTATSMRSKASRITETDEKIRWESYSLGLGHYTSETYENMNRFLRGMDRAPYRDANLSDAFIHKMNHYLKEYFDKEANVLPEDYRLYRGIKDANLVFGEYAKGDLTGTVFQEKGFLSTTLNGQTAKQFMDNDYSGTAPAPVMMRILGKKGQKAVGGNAFETEIVFPAGTKLRVVKDYEKDGPAKWELVKGDLIQVPNKQRWLDVEIVE